MSRRNQLLVGDARDRLTQLKPGSVDMVLTSPPYFRLRDYGVDGQLGLESSVDSWVNELVQVLSLAGKTLVPTGTLWLNLGDSYAMHTREGASRKSLLLGPERLALQMLSAGWVLRNKLIWQKASPMPTSVKDRLACTYEVVYVFAKQASYFFDLDSIRQPHSRENKPHRATGASREAWRGPNSSSAVGLSKLKALGLSGHPLGKNPGDVWRIANPGSPGHHATFPLTLAQRAIRAGSPEARCRICRAPWRRTVQRTSHGEATRGDLRPSCTCSPTAEPSVVLDPFFGSGTTGLAAERLGRNWLGIELNPGYADLAERRLHEARAGPSQDHRSPQLLTTKGGTA